MRRTGLILAGAAISLLVVAGCSSSDTSAPATTVAIPTTATAPTTTAPKLATGSAATIADAAAVLVAAWQHNDLAQAATIADPIAVEGMWATPREMINLRSCSDDNGLSEGGCVYRTPSGLVQINTTRRANGWVVTGAIYDAYDDGNVTSGDAPAGPPPTTVN